MMLVILHLAFGMCGALEGSQEEDMLAVFGLGIKVWGLGFRI